jgi:hypothetical protein
VASAELYRPVQPLVPLVGGPAAEVLGPAVARRHLEAVGPAEETRVQGRDRGQVHRGNRLAAEERLVGAAAPESGGPADPRAPLLLALELGHALGPLQRIRSERSLREEVLKKKIDRRHEGSIWRRAQLLSGRETRNG